MAQVTLRAGRLGGAAEVEILAETDLDVVCATLEAERPDVCVIDSVQTLHAPDLGSAPGSVAQVREAAGRLLRVAKQAGVATILVGHVTKDGAVAGPRVLEHLVDCVLQFEGDRYHAHRVLRAVKNRFGSTNELGVFEMTAAGLVGVPDPSELFGRTRPGEVGAAVACALEGTRPILLEVQALVAKTDLAMPRRVGTGVDPKRLAMIVAVLSRHAGVPLGGADVFVNVAGGVRIDEPGADLAVALAIASAARGAPVRDGMAAFGEIGLTGRLRVAAQAERRLEECAEARHRGGRRARRDDRCAARCPVSWPSRRCAGLSPPRSNGRPARRRDGARRRACAVTRPFSSSEWGGGHVDAGCIRHRVPSGQPRQEAISVDLLRRGARSSTSPSR